MIPVPVPVGESGIGAIGASGFGLSRPNNHNSPPPTASSGAIHHHGKPSLVVLVAAPGAVVTGLPGVALPPAGGVVAPSGGVFAGLLVAAGVGAPAGSTTVAAAAVPLAIAV